MLSVEGQRSRIKLWSDEDMMTWFDAYGGPGGRIFRHCYVGSLIITPYWITCIVDTDVDSMY